MSEQHCEAPRSLGEGASMEVADIFRANYEEFIRDRSLTPRQHKALRDIMACRTEALGGHMDVCLECGYYQVSYNSCRNRHCPKCQSLQQARWIAQRKERLLPVRYFHMVFTLPGDLRMLTRWNQKLIFGFLFKSASETIMELGRDPRHLGGQVGITAVLHTWARDLTFHPHVHCLVTGGGLSPLQDSWVPSRGKRFFAPVEVLSSLFRGKFMALLSRSYRESELCLDGPLSPLEDLDSFHRFKDRLYRKKWVANSRPPFEGVWNTVEYLGRYTHRVGISNQRLISMNDEGVTFSTRDGKTTTISAIEFMKRFVSHVLPSGFVKLRHYGLFSSTNVNGRLKRSLELLLEEGGDEVVELPCARKKDRELSWEELLLGLTGDDPFQCPGCGVGRLERYPLLEKEELNLLVGVEGADTS